MAIKSARDHIRDIDRQKRERARYEREREDMEYTADLRDDVVSLIRNSGLTLAQIHARCGPTPNTLLNWMDKRTMRPQMGKMQAVLRILGKDLGIVETRRGGDRTNVRRTFRVIK